jgi:hypothetical protein
MDYKDLTEYRELPISVGALYECVYPVSPEDRREIIKMRNITDHPESRFFLVNTTDEELLTEATVRLDQLANHFVGQIDEYICNRFKTPTV